MIDLTLGTVMSSRIRLARNLNGYPFPARLKSDRQAKEIIRAVSAAINRLDEFGLYYMDGISKDDALNLVENRLISPALLNTPSRSAVLIRETDNAQTEDLHYDLSIMINEEDHLREQCIAEGLSIRKAYELMSEKDSLIAHSIPFAYDERLGYLTACPTNLGTGLRASVMLFLPALELTGMMSDVFASVRTLGLTVRGAYGEGTAAKGYTYQISNEVTLGVSEEKILTEVETVVKKIVQMEASKRQELKKCSQTMAVKDKCMRAYGVLTNCALLNNDELDSLCADIKLGVCLGFLKVNEISSIDELMHKTKPSNLNMLSGRQLSGEEREIYLAQYASNRIKSLVFKC
ncbi:MAG: ATP--guanido phosphotransferase [Clostridia bacterium]|nr:ATP--guanido phosphotransferase [Clostridia bacterium]